jgi:hypothetical protein
MTKKALGFRVSLSRVLQELGGSDGHRHAATFKCCISWWPISSSAVAREDGPSELNEIGDATALWLPRHPEFQILNAVVVLDAVLVMHTLIRRKWPTKVFGHDKAVNELPLAISIDIATDVALSRPIVLARANELLCRATAFKASPMDVAKTMACDIGFAVID